MKPLAHVEERVHGGVAVAAVQGEIDVSNAVEIGDRLREMITNRGRALIVDLSATTYLDSAGINLLFEIGHELRERQQRLLVVVAQPSPVARMLAITGLDAAMPTYATLETALAAAAAP
jgi:anti-sigma B factor antagonist